MPYNIDLEYMIDRLTGRLGDIAKRRMFGGIGYMLNGNLCFGIHKEYLIIRTSKEKAEELLEEEYIQPFDITGKAMKGWVLVSPDYVETEEQLLEMLEIAVSFVEKLPPK